MLFEVDESYLSAFLAAGFFAAGFLAGAFLAAGLAAGAFFAAGFLAAGFLAASSLTPASLAALLRALLRRATVFFFKRPFLTAVSNSEWAAAKVVAVGFAWKALTADLMSFLMPIFFSRRLTACLARLMADLMIGMVLLYLYKLLSLIKDALYRKSHEK